MSRRDEVVTTARASRRMRASQIEEQLALSGANDSLVVFLHGVGALGADLAPLAEPLSAFLPSTAFVAPDAPARFDGGGPARQWFSVAGISAENRPQRVEQAREAFDRVIVDGDRRARLRRPPRPRRLVRLLAGLDHGARRDRQRPLAGRGGRRRFRPFVWGRRSASRRGGDAGAAAARRGRRDGARRRKPPRRDAAEGGRFHGRNALLRAARPFDFRRRRRSGGGLPRPRA